MSRWPSWKLVYCYALAVVLALSVLTTLRYRLPRALSTLEALEAAELHHALDHERSREDFRPPDEWKFENGAHLFITEDDQFICKPENGAWVVVDINKVREAPQRNLQSKANLATPSCT